MGQRAKPRNNYLAHTMASKRPARIPTLYRVIAITFVILLLGWMLFVYRPGAG